MKLSLILLVLFVVSFTSAQNLVPNPSFEEYDTCLIPNDWDININTADYFNTCDSINGLYAFGVPSNGFGYQNAFSANGYCGLFSYVAPFFNNYNDTRELIGAQLSSTLIPGTKYYVNFKTSLAEGSNCATSKLGILFTTSNYGYTNTNIIPAPLVNNYAHVYSSSIITDTSGWVNVSGYFIADSAYSHIFIGNFFSKNNIDSLMVSAGNYCGSYYFIDDVCVSADSITCNLTTSILEAGQKNTINIFPNPFNHSTTVTIQDGITNMNNASFIIYDTFGKEVMRFPISQKIFKIQRDSLGGGIYLLQINNQNKTYYKKIIITN